MKRPRLIFIVGPTASGKTELALQEAERTGGSILSCDSLCVYRGMDIGTAKPTPEEQARAPHYGIDLAEPDKAFSVSRYITYRDGILEKLRNSGTPVIVAGGSGFYLKSYFSPVTDKLEIPPEVEARVEGVLQEEGLAGLVDFLRSLHGSSETFPGLDMRNPRRVQKAVVRCLASGRSYSELLDEFRSLPEPLNGWNKEVWLVSRPKASLQARNVLRVKAMLEAGLIEEVRRLREKGFEKNPSACGAIGYREVLSYLDNPVAEEALMQEIVLHTNQLMRKQRTWFRHHIPVDREVQAG